MKKDEVDDDELDSRERRKQRGRLTHLQDGEAGVQPVAHGIA